MARLVLLGPAREAAGVSSATVQGNTVEEILQSACGTYGSAFEAVVRVSQIWVNGEPAQPDSSVEPRDEVAVLPPVSGG
jgi:molybdopterin converting factor small subunit